MPQLAAYRGRFAPSPSGPLHFGSLVCALASYLDAKSHDGKWFLRIDDLDAPRVAPGAVTAILQALEVYGLIWDGAVHYQSGRAAAYAQAFEQLRADGLIYACACSRREIADSQVAPDLAGIYPGHCRAGAPGDKPVRGWRLVTHGACVQFEDRLQGRIEQDLEKSTGDFILRRADGSFAYQLAAVVDDAALGVSDAVRGADLLDSTARQIYIQQLLGLPRPRYLHLPVAVNALGEKLSKQTLATPLDVLTPLPTLLRALDFLGQAAPPASAALSVDQLINWSIAHWDAGRIPRMRSITVLS